MTILELLCILVFSFALSFIIMVASIKLTFKEWYVEKITAYECGFSPIRKPHQPFSIKFFLVGVIFLIFDLEVMYLLPWSINTQNLSFETQISVLLFLIFMAGGLIYEWFKGGLEWI